MKRLTDFVLAGAALVVLTPVFAVVACAIWLDDHGPVFYGGSRVGCGGRQFQILKFRTMRLSDETGSAITIAADPRVTRVGRVLRASKLDELPQLINVLRGEMSLVGPRPEAPAYVEIYTPEQRKVLAVRPGMTGLTQIRFRHEEHLLTGSDPETYYRTVIMPAKLALDLHYVRHATYWGDLKLMALTVAALVRPARVEVQLSQTALLRGMPDNIDIPLLPDEQKDEAQSVQVAVSEQGGGVD